MSRTLVIDEGIRQCQRTLVIMSSDLYRSSEPEAVAWRAFFASGSPHPVVPVLVRDEAVSGLLSDLRHIALFGRDKPAATRELLAGVRAAIEGESKPADPPPFPGPVGATADAGSTRMAALPSASAYSPSPKQMPRSRYQSDLSLPDLRLWIDRLASNYRQIQTDEQRHAKKQAAAHLKQLDALVRAFDDSSRSAKGKDDLRRLLAAGVAKYLSGTVQIPSEHLPAQILADVVVYALWMVVSAPKLPDAWESNLLEISSPRLVEIVAIARRTKELTMESFARAVTSKPVSQAALNLLEDLNDPKRGGAALLPIAKASRLPHFPLRGGAGAMIAWCLGGATLGFVAGSHSDTLRSGLVEMFGEDLVAEWFSPGDDADIDLERHMRGTSARQHSILIDLIDDIIQSR